MIEADSTTAACCEQNDQPSGQMFDWWRCGPEGKIVQTPRPPPPPPPYRPPPLRKDQLCWPMYQTSRFENIVKESDSNKQEAPECDPSKDFWPDTQKRMVRKPALEHARPPWRPASAHPESGCCGGSMKLAHQYERSCSDRQKPVASWVSRP